MRESDCFGQKLPRSTPVSDLYQKWAEVDEKIERIWRLVEPVSHVLDASHAERLRLRISDSRWAVDLLAVDFGLDPERNSREFGRLDIGFHQIGTVIQDLVSERASRRPPEVRTAEQRRLREFESGTLRPLEGAVAGTRDPILELHLLYRNAVDALPLLSAPLKGEPLLSPKKIFIDRHPLSNQDCDFENDLLELQEKLGELEAAHSSGGTKVGLAMRGDWPQQRTPTVRSLSH